jgi:hypothetical protein
MDIFTSITPTPPAPGPMRSVLQMLQAIEGVEVAILLAHVDGPFFEIVEATGAGKTVGSCIALAPKITIPPAGRSTSDLRMPTAFTLMSDKRPSWIAAKQLTGTGLRLVALCSQNPPLLESQLEAAAATMAELDRHGAKSELERLQQIVSAR